MNEIEKLFKSKALNRGGIVLYSKQDTLAFIVECGRFKIKLLGIDGFFLTNTSIQPSMEDSVDFSTITYKGKNILVDALSFVESKDENLYFEIVCE